MITGFNTDIEFQGTTYHVQTEDKGVKTPLILSLVYDRGTILASKRSTYNDLLIGKFDEKVLAERLQKQHNLICAAIKTGRIEDLKRMTAKDAAATKQKTAIAIEQEIKSPEVGAKISRAEITPKPDYQEPSKSFDQSNAEKISGSSIQNLPIEKNEFVFTPKGEQIWDVPISVLEEPIIEATGIVEEFILPAEAVEIVTEDFGASESISDTKLKVKLLNNEKFKSGEQKTIRVLVNRGNARKGLSGAQIMVKVLGSSFRPSIFHAKTDANGLATVHLQLPKFSSGRAALLIKAMSEGDEVDLRRAITRD